MHYLKRKEFLYDMEMFGLEDTQTALRIYGEYVWAASPKKPLPKFFEVDRSDVAVDHLWHMPVTERTIFTRTLDVPAIVTFDKPNQLMTKLGKVPTQSFKFTLANIHLRPEDERAKAEMAAAGNAHPVIRLDYFPQRGDLIYYIGYRLMITNVVLEPAAYWAQTNVWMGLICEATIAPDGDARPIPDLSKPAPAELPGSQPLPDWPGEPATGHVPHLWP